MRFKLHPYDLQLEHTFRISREAHDVQPTLIVQLYHLGEYGLGETTANPYYGSTVPEMIATIEAVRGQLETHQFAHPNDFNQLLLELFPKNSFIRCALDMAAHDLFGKLKGKPLYELYEHELKNLPLSNYTIGLDSIEVMTEKLKLKPWPIYKIKLGTDHDIEIVKALRAVTDAIFRIDANCAWSASETIENSKALKTLGVEFIEQPMAEEAIGEMPEVKKHSVLPLIADESCQVVSDVEKCAGAFHGVNIKLTKCGGLTPALEMLRIARTRNLKTMVGCMTESSVGISAIAHLLPQLDYVDMDGAILLKHDIADGVKLDMGKAIFPDRVGSGALLIKN